VEVACVTGANCTSPHALVMLGEDVRPRISDPNFRKEVDERLKRLMEEANKGLDPHEQLKFIVVVRDEWTIENNFLTPTMKLKRNVVEDAYQNKVEDWYSRSQAIIW